MITPTDWQIYADWALGNLSDDDYANHLEQRMAKDGVEDPAERMWIRHLRRSPKVATEE